MTNSYSNELNSKSYGKRSSGESLGTVGEKGRGERRKGEWERAERG